VLSRRNFPRPAFPRFGAGPTPRVGLALSVLLLLATTSACYRYAPLLGELPAPGEEVRLRLAGPAAAELSDRVGRPIRSVEGSVLAAGPDSLQVDVGWGAIYAGTVFEGRRDTLRFGVDQVLEVDRKEFSRARTAGITAALAAVVVVLFRSISGGGGGTGGDPGGGTPPVI
jgi:hypothetical protein